ncbi:MAG: GHMP family kinase ATP-binding protein [Promethearchaeota archaeon]
MGFNSMVKLRKVEVWVPHRISGFFQMMNPKDKFIQTDLTKIGSRGGGPALTAFGKTKITILHADEENRTIPKINLKVCMNGEENTSKAKTSCSVVNLMAPLLPKNINLLIEHDFDLPLGAGFGSSGAGALGISYGLNALFKLGLTPLDSAKFAHIAEVENKTGLGTVGGQFAGGLSIMTNPGYPFQYKKIQIPENIEIVLGSWGSINTKSILTNPSYKQLIHQVGKKTMKKMNEQFSLENYMNVCKYFIEKTDLLERLNLPILKNIIETLEKLQIIGASMAQLGKSVFCVCEKQISKQVIKTFNQFNPSFGPKIVNICNNGPEIKRIE